MVVTCEIVFDQNLHGIYFAGQIVSGRVIINSDKLEIYKGIALKIIGFARTKWTDNSDMNVKQKSSKDITIYHGREEYIAFTYYLLGSKESETVQIQPGSHNFSFSSTLPAQCPSSFEGKFGHIRYMIKIVLLRPWKFDQTYSRGFTVLKLMNLNYDSPILKVPAIQEVSKTFFCGPCTSQPFKLKILVPQTGFVPGQDIVINMTAVNESTIKITEINIRFFMLVSLFSQQPKMNSYFERINLVEIKAGSIDSKTTRTMIQIVRVPATPPTCFHSCRLIKISYELEIKAKLKAMHQDPVITIPITVGNVPIAETITYQPLPDPNKFLMASPAIANFDETDSVEGQVSTISSRNLQPAIDFDDSQIPPPSYEEATFMTRANCNEEDSNALGESEFLPRYPVYYCTEPCSVSEDIPFTNNDPNKSTWL